MSGKGHKWLAASTATLIAEPVLALAHQGGVGVILGLAAGAAAYALIDDVEQATGKSLALPARRRAARSESNTRGKSSLAHRLLVGKSYREEEEAGDPDTEDLEVDEADDTVIVSDPGNQVDEDEPFLQEEVMPDVPPVRRITVSQIVEHTRPNSYEVYIGRSLTKANYPAVKINFYKRHLKIIGASQKGKSSLVGALLEAILLTHDHRHVQVALLDSENRTSRIFADTPHVLRLRIDGEVIRFHARSYEEVRQQLEYLRSFVDHRYALAVQSPDALEQQPLVIVYLEEFLDLKNHFKALCRSIDRDTSLQAKQDYAQLVANLNKIAERGLKVKVQLLLCAQVNYADEDLREAFASITSGLSFCVRPEAARAAGFYQNELLQRNARDNAVGQAVAEMPDCKDLILAPEYHIDELLATLPPPEAPARQEPLAFPTAHRDVAPDTASAHQIPAVAPSPIAMRRRVSVQDALAAWQQGAQGPRAMERALNIPYNQARDLITELRHRGLIPQEEDDARLPITGNR
jgi:hypothetical protein